MPVGELMGMVIGSLEYNWILIFFVFLPEFSVIMAEPAVRALITKVEKLTGTY